MDTEPVLVDLWSQFLDFDNVHGDHGDDGGDHGDDQACQKYDPICRDDGGYYGGDGGGDYGLTFFLFYLLKQKYYLFHRKIQNSGYVSQSHQIKKKSQKISSK